ncbi:MAG: serine/threonine-protein kinase [Mariniblastus sp.]|nr:serine/threonine-protein kinase [Mariniblastus sp.]
MKLRFTVIAGPDAGRSFLLDAGKALVFGRGEKSGARLKDPSVSRVHFEIGHDGEGVLVADQGSSSGTYVNGAKIEKSQIPLGGVIQAGDTRIRVEAAEQTEMTMTPEVESKTAESKPLPELVGTELGPYKLIEIIGKGNSGLVFKGHDAEKDRIAAVKVLTPQYTANDEQRQRFVRAMKTMLPIKDDRIVRLYNAGKNGPYCWAAMEFIEGENLAELIERIGIEGMLDWKKVWRVAVDVGRALHTGYESKIVHRNVTPKNILRRASDEACLLGDFMLAKALEGTLAQQVTQPGQILGEVPYLAPERTRADTEIDTRADLYGLGATCYALLTGKPPITEGSLTEMVRNVREESPEPPKKYQLSVNEMFQDVVMTLIAKDPEERFETPAKLIKELLRIGKFNSLDAGF